MQTLKKDLKHGTVSVRIENMDDLWHLEHVVQPGDLIRSRTMRKVSVKQGGEHKLGSKKPMTLTIRLEKAGFEPSGDSLRLAGKITDGPPDTPLSSYHTIQVTPGTTLAIQKGKWSGYQLKRLEEARTRHPRLLICVLDRDGADFAVLLDRGIEQLASIPCEDPENRERYHAGVLKFIKAQEGWERVVIAGPGFEAENLFRHIKAKSPETASKAFMEHCSHCGHSGITEVLKRSGEHILRETRIGQESSLVDELLARIKSDGLVTYGKAHVEKAVGLGAVETMLISRENVPEMESLMEACERNGGQVRLITSDHQLGEQFLHLGGIAAMLRFRIDSQM